MTAKELREKLEKDLEELQRNCSHPSYTVCQEMWAPGHMGGYVNVCDVCEKVKKICTTNMSY